MNLLDWIHHLGYLSFICCSYDSWFFLWGLIKVKLLKAIFFIFRFYFTSFPHELLLLIPVTLSYSSAFSPNMNSFQTSRFCLFGETSVRSQTYWKRSHDTAGVLGEGVHRGFKCRGLPVGRPCNQSWTWRRKESDVQHKMRENSVRVCARACACVCACVCVSSGQ